MFAEPREVAEQCSDFDINPANFEGTLAPTDLGFAHDIGYISDNVVEFVLNDFPGQTVLSTSAAAIFGYDYDASATTLYALNYDTNEFGTFDPSTGTFTAIGPSVPGAGENWTGLTIDPSSDTFYASASACGSYSNLYTLDPATGTPTVVGDITGATCVIDIAMNPSGDMYAHDIVTDSMYQVDPSTGAGTLLGPTGYPANYAQGMDFDNDDGTLYIFLYQGGGANVYGTVDLVTGAVTPLATNNPLGEFEGAIPIPGVVTKGTLNGTVTEAGTGNPIDGALVVAENITDTYGFSTDATGFYSDTVNVGTYTVTASMYGYVPGTATGVEVFLDTITTQDFVLDPATFYTVDGYVTDVNTGWPLYASIAIDGYPGDPVWTDPVTGYYSISLAEGVEYTFNVDAWVAGYMPDSRTVGPLVGDTQEDFALDVDVVACEAPGYELVVGFFEDFEASDGGFVPSGTYVDWEWGTPTAWPDSCSSGVNCWGTVLSGNYQNSSNETLLSPVIDLSGETAPLTVFWDQAYHIESSTWDHAYAEVSINGGPFAQMWSHTGGTTQSDWTTYNYDISGAAGGTVQFQFRFDSDSSVSYPGYYIDTISIPTGCEPPDAGGLVVGNVYDGNTMDALVGAEVTNEDLLLFVTEATPDDPAVDDGFYTLFGSTSQYFTATITGGYGPDTEMVTVVDFDTVDQDFYLPAAWLDADPSPLHVTLDWGTGITETLDLSNNGGEDTDFEIKEVAGGYIPLLAVEPLGTTGPIEGWDPSDTAPAEFLGTLPSGIIPEMWGLGTAIPTGAQYQGAGATIDNENFYLFGGYDGLNMDQTLHYDTATGVWTTMTPMPTGRGNIHAYYDFDTGLIYVPGGYSPYLNVLEAYDPGTDTWTTLAPMPVAKSGADGGIVDGKLYLFGGNGGGTNETQIYDIATDTWAMGTSMPGVTHRYGGNVTVDNYIYVVGGFGETTFLRYDTTTDTWEAGPPLNAARNSPNVALSTDGIVYAVGGGDGWTPRYDSEYYDLADWPGGSWTMDVTDPSAFPTIRGGHACASNLLWIEAGSPSHDNNQYWDGLECAWAGAGDVVPWVSEDPITGTVTAMNNMFIAVAFDSSVVSQPGDYYADLKFINDSPYGDLFVPLTMTVNPASDMGKVHGYVTDNCLYDPLEDVYIEMVGGFPISETVTDEDGYYTAWLVEGIYDFVFSLAGYDTFTETVDVVAGETFVLDVGLVPDRPCIEVYPDMFEVWLITETLVYTDPMGMDITNNGGQDLDFDLVEIDGGYAPPLALEPVESNVVLFGDLGFSTDPAGVVASAVPVQPPVPPEAVLITHSLDQSIIAINSVSCNAGGLHTDNGYLRKFTLSDFGITGDFNVTNVQIGIETATGAGGTQPGTMNLYTWNPADAFIYANFTLIGTADTMVADQALTIIDVPVVGTAPAGSTLVVEFFTPNGQTAGNSLFVGSNNLGQTDFTYLAAADCGVPEPIDTGSLGFPGMHLVMNVVGEVGAAGVDWFWEVPESGTVPALDMWNIDVAFTAVYSDMVTPMPLGVYTATLEVNNNDPVADTPVLPVTMHIVEQFEDPVPSFVSDEPVCLGETMTFTNTTVEGVPPVDYFVWDFGDGVTMTLDTFDNVTHVYAADGIYDVTLMAYQKQTGLMFSFTDTVEVKPLPMAGFSYTQEQLTIHFTNLSENATTYLWDFGDGITSTLESPSHDYPASDYYTVTLWAFGDCGAAYYEEVVWPQASDVEISKMDMPDPVAPGGTLTYDLMVTNNGPDTAWSVMVVDTLPAGTTFVSASAGCVEAAGVVTCDLGDMLTGATATVTIEVTAPADYGSITNMAEVTTNSFDADLTNNTISEDTMVGFFTFLPVVFGSD
jgi:uncharacterized repeat protein (TIGR01451 family)